MANFLTRLFTNTSIPTEPNTSNTAVTLNTEPRLIAAKPPRRNFAAAAQNRLTFDWNVSYQSADQEVLANLGILRGRSRTLCKDNVYAARYLQLVVTNAIGSAGITPSPRNINADGTLNTDVNKAIEAAFNDWGKAVSTDGKFSWLALEHLIARTVPQDGEIFIRMITGAPNKYRFALQVLESDYLDHQYNRLPDKDGNEIRQGVEIDEYGTPVAYWFWTRHPAEGYNSKRIRVPADEVIHLFRPVRPHQTRGLPWLVPAMRNLHILGELEIAELVAVRTAACKMGFVTTGAENAQPYTDDNSDLANSLPFEIMEGQPGMITRLDPGDSFEAWNPDHPGSNFDTFTKEILRGIASSLNVSYSSLTSDFGNENYSSARIGLMNERDYWRGVQSWLICHYHEKIYVKWLQAALLSGALKVGTRSTKNLQTVLFRPRGFQFADPVKEMAANETAIALGLNSRTRVLQELGIDPEDVFADLQREAELAQKYGIDISGVKASKPPTTALPVTIDAQTEQAAEQEDTETEGAGDPDAQDEVTENES